MGDGTACATTNGYAFGSYPGTNLGYGSGGYGTSSFLSGATSGDANFDAVLNNAELGIGSGTLTLSNLTVGTTYNALFLAADTRTGMGTRAFSMAAGTTSPSQSYAYAGGSPYLGGYVLATFTATNTTQIFTNTAAGYGYQLNGVLVTTTVTTSPPPHLGAVIGGGQIQFGWPAGYMGWRLEAQTNPAGVGLNTNWFTVSGSAVTNQASNPVNLANGSSFFRLIYP